MQLWCGTQTILKEVQFLALDIFAVIFLLLHTHNMWHHQRQDSAYTLHRWNAIDPKKICLLRGLQNILNIMLITNTKVKCRIRQITTLLSPKFVIA